MLNTRKYRPNHEEVVLRAWIDFTSEAVDYYERVVELGQSERNLEREGELKATLNAFLITQFEDMNAENAKGDFEEDKSRRALDWLIQELKTSEEFISVNIFEDKNAKEEPKKCSTIRKKTSQELRREEALLENGHDWISYEPSHNINEREGGSE